jgi:hypothetical protein
MLHPRQPSLEVTGERAGIPQIDFAERKSGGVSGLGCERQPCLRACSHPVRFAKEVVEIGGEPVNIRQHGLDA